MALTIHQLEYRANRAQPALATRYYDGWLLRFANNYTRRANSIHALYGSSENLDEKIATCEKIYTDAGMRTIFKMTEAVHPTDLDNELAQRGYRREGETGVFVLEKTPGQIIPTPTNIRSDDIFSQDWLSAYCHLNDVPDQHHETLRKMLRLIIPRCCFMTLLDNDKTIIGVALAVAEGDHTGIFDVVIDPAQRGKGYGKQLMHGLLAWSNNQKAKIIYLQVTAHNTAARALYHSAGFKEHYQYWYRTKDLKK